MSDNDKKSDKTESENPDTNASADAPEVEVEVVETPACEEAAASEEQTDEKVAETSAVETDDALNDQEGAAVVEPEQSSNSPGLMLFGFFAAAALGIFLLFQMNRGEAPGEAMQQTASIASHNPGDAQTNDTSPTTQTTDTGAEDVDTPTVAETPVTSDTDEQDAVEDASELFAADPETDATELTANDVADNIVADETAPSSDDVDETVDPRAAIAALQRATEMRTASDAENTQEEQVSAEEPDMATAETALEEATDAPTTEEISNQVDETATDIAETVEATADEADEAASSAHEAIENLEATADVSDTVELGAADETVGGETEEVISADAETTDETDTVSVEEDAVDVADVSEAAEAETEDMNAEEEAFDVANDDAEIMDQAPAQTDAQDIAALADSVSANTGKIANELESLKEALREETNALAAAVSEGRQLTEQQSTRITELRESLEQALLERDERANTEIAALRDRLDKIQSSSTETPAGRKAAASLALLALQRAVDEGEPFTDELAVIERLAPEASILDGLRASANDGTPTLAALKTQFAPAVRSALAASDDGEATGIMGRIQKLISVRPATPQPGDRPAAVISRAEAELEEDDLAGTVEELSGLSGGPEAAFADWMALAQKRLAASSAIETLNAALLNEYDQ